jgi:hypothetical protein
MYSTLRRYATVSGDHFKGKTLTLEHVCRIHPCMYDPDDAAEFEIVSAATTSDGALEELRESHQQYIACHHDSQIRRC